MSLEKYTTGVSVIDNKTPSNSYNPPIYHNTGNYSSTTIGNKIEEIVADFRESPLKYILLALLIYTASRR